MSQQNGVLTSSQLIADVKRKAMIPTNQSTFQDQDFLDIANSELLIGLLPSILKVHEEYYVWNDPQAFTANQSSYPIPYRAVGQRLRDLMYTDNNGNYRNMARVSPDDKDIFQQSYVATQFLFFYVQGNNYTLIPAVGPTPPGSLQTTYYMRPNALVTEDRVATIKNITVNTVTNLTTYTVDQIPSGYSTTVLFDLLQTRPGHQLIDYDLTPTEVNTTNLTITFPTDPRMQSVIVGDYVAFAGECIIPQCPPELHSVLVQRVIARVLDALGDAQGLNNANVKLQEMEQKTLQIITDRVEGAPIKVTNRRGLLRSGKMFRRWYT